MSERPVQARPRRLADWINPTGAKKVHSLIDKVYRQENVLMAWKGSRRAAAVEVSIGRRYRVLKRSGISSWVGCGGVADSDDVNNRFRTDVDNF
jgi:hypothetical protein